MKKFDSNEVFGFIKRKMDSLRKTIGGLLICMALIYIAIGISLADYSIMKMLTLTGVAVFCIAVAVVLLGVFGNELWTTHSEEDYEEIRKPIELGNEKKCDKMPKETTDPFSYVTRLDEIIKEEKEKRSA